MRHIINRIGIVYIYIYIYITRIKQNRREVINLFIEINRSNDYRFIYDRFDDQSRIEPSQGDLGRTIETGREKEREKSRTLTPL
jgi:hypothetical protein